MKNKKLLKIIAATIVCSAMGISAFSFAACDSNQGNDGGENGGETGHKHSYTWVDDENGTTHHEHCGVDGCDAPDKAPVNHADSDKDEVCDDCGADLHKHAYSDDWTYDVDKHWHASTCGHADEISGAVAHNLNAQGKCSVCGVLIANYQFNTSDFEAKTYDSGLTSGIFSIGAGTVIRTKTPRTLCDENGKAIKDVDYSKSIQMKDAVSRVEINAPAAGVFEMHVANGSGSVMSNQLTISGPDGSKTISYYATGSSGPLVAVKMEFSQKGKYVITRVGGTSDIFYMSYKAIVEDTPVEKIEVAATGKVNYYVGQDISYDGLAVNAVHAETGRLSPVLTSALNVTSDYDKTTPGTYTVSISYTVEGQTFETSYDVTVYSISEVKLGTDKIIKGANSAAGNGVYENHSLRQLYFVNDTVSDDGLSVTLSGGEGENKQEFLLKSSEYSLSTVDTSTPGKKTVTVSVESNGTTVSETFDIYVIAKDADLATANSVNIAVDGAITDADIGVKNGAGAYQFKTIHQALDFLNNSGVKAGATKTINLAAGYYWEKLEVKVPNLTIVGAGKDTTTIEYDSLYGIKDAGGFEHTTDSTATLNVREGAVNFTIKGVTVSNWFNSLARFDEKLGESYPEHRALALLVQSDKFIMDDCKLLGYQDTVEFFTGRQYIINTYIAGTTDFIFGTNNTTYFYNCQIHSISNGKTDGGYITAFKGSNKGAGDYVTYGAIFDHCNFTADEGVVKKGDNDGTVTTGNTAIGRCWGAYAAVAVINSEIGGHVSTVTGGFSKNERYISMGTAKPTDETVKFREYNNTGDGSITSKVNGMQMLSETEAANYSNLSVVFGTTNGKVSYSSVWIPVLADAQTYIITVYDQEEHLIGTVDVVEGSKLLLAQLQGVVAENNEYSSLDIEGVYSNKECTTEYGYPDVSASGNVYVKLVEGPVSANVGWNFTANKEENQITEGTAKLGKLHVDATDGTFVFHNTGWSKLTGNATLSLDLLADTVVTIGSYDDGLSFTLTGAESADALKVVFSNQVYTVEVREAGTLVIGRKGNGYVSTIGVEVNAGLSMEKSTVTLYNGEEVVGTISVWNGSTITEQQLNELKASVTAPEGQEFDNFYANPECTTPYDYTTVISENKPVYIGWTTATDYIEENTTINFGSTGNYNNYLTNGKLIITPPEGSSWNGEQQAQCNKIVKDTVVEVKVKKGAKVIVTSYSGYTNYTVDGHDYTTTANIFEVSEDGNFTLTSKDGNYIYSITVLYELTKADSGYTYTYNQGGRDDNALEESQEKIFFVDCAVNNSWLRLDKGRSAVVLNVDSGAQIVVTTNGGNLKISDGTVSANGTTVTLTSTKDGYVLIYIDSTQEYLQTITIS